MRIAFHAPLKPADHPVPSGDRTLARGFIALLARLGHRVEIASRFRSLERDGDDAAQRRLIGTAERDARHYIAAARQDGPPDLWFTYHLHHRAPDLVGPRVARALDIPYVVAEPSFAARRADGPWARFHGEAAAALARADGLLCLTARDADGLTPVLPAGVPATVLPPFLDDAWFAAAPPPGNEPPHLVAAGMMRARAKLASFRLLADALRHLGRPVRLTIAGDGPARAAVEAAFAGIPGDIRFAGLLEAPALRGLFAQADLMAWPAVGEAFGMALVEAQASGLPVVAGRAGAVAEVGADGETGLLVPPGDAAAFAAALAALMDDAPLRRRLGAAALARARVRHTMAAAMAAAAPVLESACRRRRPCRHAS